MKDRGFRCPFEGCGQRYASRYNVKRHVVASHPSFIANQCSVCHRVLSSRQNFRQHQFIHSGVKPYKCSICSEMFRQSSQLSLHRKRHFQQARTQPIAKVTDTQLTDMLQVAQLPEIAGIPLVATLVQLPPLDLTRSLEKEDLPDVSALC